MFELALVDDLFGFPHRQLFVNGNNSKHVDGVLTNPNHNRSLMRTDFMENEQSYVLNAELPGYDKDKINLFIKDGVLTMEAEKQETKSESNDTYHFKERSWGKVHRSFRLPVNASQKDVTTTYVNGILNITFPKIAQESQKLSIA